MNDELAIAMARKTIILLIGGAYFADQSNSTTRALDACVHVFLGNLLSLAVLIS